MKALSENKMAMFNIAATFAVSAISIITTPIFTRLLSTSEYGLVATFLAWSQIVCIFLGFEAKGSIAPAKVNLQEDEQNPYQASVLLLVLMNLIILLLLAFLFEGFLSTLLKMPRVCIPLLFLQSFASAVMAILNERFTFNKMAQVNFILSVSVAIASGVLGVVFVLSIQDYDLRYLGRIIGFLIPPLTVAFTACAWMIIKNRRNIRLKYWKFCLSLTAPLILHGLSSVLLAQVGRLGVQYYWGDSLVGIYSIAITIASFIGLIQSSLNTAFVPFMFDDLAGKTNDSIKREHFENYMILFTIGFCAYLCFAPELLKIFAPPEYWEAIGILPILILGYYFMFLYTFPVNFEFYVMKTKYIGIGSVIASALCIGLAVLLIPSSGMFGAAFATTAANGCLFASHFLIARFLWGDKNYSAVWIFSGMGIAIAATVFASLTEPFVVLRWLIGFILMAILVFRLFKTRRIF